MRSSTVHLLVALAIAGTASACLDSHQSDPAPNSPSQVVTRAAACQFGLILDKVRGYFAAGDRRIGLTLVAQMRAFNDEGDAARATDKGFDLLALTAAATDAGRQIGTPRIGSELANALLACMRVGEDNQADFVGPLGPGAFAVRGGPNDPTGPVLSRDDFSGIGLLADKTWSGVLGRRTLVFGQPNPIASFNEVLVGSPYDWSTLPALPQISPGAIMGFCIENTGRLRVDRDHGGNETLLFLQDPSFFLACPTLTAASRFDPRLRRSLFDKLATFAVAFLAPTPLSATAFHPGPVGGAATGFSDFATVDALGINLTYLRQPASATAGGLIPRVQVIARGDGGTPLPEVTMTVSLIRMQGTGTLSGTLQQTTGTGGVESFTDLRVSRPGVYALLISASLSGFTTVQLQSVNFVVN